MKYIVLGSNGFIGSNIYNTLRKNSLSVIGLDRENFDITNKNDYLKFDFSNTIILDCIASIDDKESILNVNVVGLKSFVNYINANHNNFKYIYFSTTSTQISEQVNNNEYIKSKFLAEKYIKNNIQEYKIVRLIFPFGNGENENRLISRLINKIKNNEKLEIDNVTLNLTPVNLLNMEIIDLIKNDIKDINFTDSKVYSLKDIVDIIYKRLDIEPNYTFNEKRIIKLAINDDSVISKIDNIEKYVEKMVGYYE